VVCDLSGGAASHPQPDDDGCRCRRARAQTSTGVLISLFTPHASASRRVSYVFGSPLDQSHRDEVLRIRDRATGTDRFVTSEGDDSIYTAVTPSSSLDLYVD